MAVALLPASGNVGVYGVQTLHGLGRRWVLAPRLGATRVLAPRLGATMGARSTAWGDDGCSLHGLGRRWVLAPRLGATMASLHGRGDGLTACSSRATSLEASWRRSLTSLRRQVTVLGPSDAPLFIGKSVLLLAIHVQIPAFLLVNLNPPVSEAPAKPYVLPRRHIPGLCKGINASTWT